MTVTFQCMQVLRLFHPLHCVGECHAPFWPGSLFVLRENTPSPRSAQRKHPPAGQALRENTPSWTRAQRKHPQLDKCSENTPQLEECSENTPPPPSWRSAQQQQKITKNASSWMSEDLNHQPIRGDNFTFCGELPCEGRLRFFDLTWRFPWI